MRRINLENPWTPQQIRFERGLARAAIVLAAVSVGLLVLSPWLGVYPKQHTVTGPVLGLLIGLAITAWLFLLVAVPLVLGTQSLNDTTPITWEFLENNPDAARKLSLQMDDPEFAAYVRRVQAQGRPLTRVELDDVPVALELLKDARDRQHLAQAALRKMQGGDE